ncbi:MAG TPA: fused MFS/spermidine synthase, partial [Planctomycetota bacterium]|nr:fused MFS/spermidine synthase [Planctomycetota bacterium]
MPRLLPPAALLLTTGFSVMALEVLLPRLLAPSAGTSAEVWAATFAVVLSATALGNAWGGRLAEGRHGAFFARESVLIGFACAALAAAFWALRPDGLLDLLATWSPLAKGAVALAVAAGPGFALLGAVTTLATNRALAGAERPGRDLAVLGAAGALGSLAGTYACGFLLVPALPTTVGAAAIVGLLALAGLVWRRDPDRRAPVAVVVPPR